MKSRVKLLLLSLLLFVCTAKAQTPGQTTPVRTGTPLPVCAAPTAGLFISTAAPQGIMQCVNRGGTYQWEILVSTTATAANGQIPIWNNVSQSYQPGDPVISYNNPTETTAAWTSSTAQNTVLSVTLPAGTGVLSEVTVTLNQGSTITGGVVSFLGSDTTGLTNTYPVYCQQQALVVPAFASTYSLQQSVNQEFICPVGGLEAFEIKLTTAITGSGTVNVGLQPTSVPAQSVVTVSNMQTKAANVSPLVADPSVVQSLSPNNTGLPVNLSTIVQKASNVSSGSVASLTKAFVSNNAFGNSTVVTTCVGNGTAPTVTDSNNSYKQAVQVANGTALNCAVWYATNIVAGANTVTVTNGGSTASIAMEIYELAGPIELSPQILDMTTFTTSGAATTSPATTLTSSAPNEYSFVAFGLGTAAQTITVAAPFTNDSGQQNPTTPAGLFSFVSASYLKPDVLVIVPSATVGVGEPWAVVGACFRPVNISVGGTVNARMQQDTGTPSYHASKKFAASSTTDVAVLPGAAGVKIIVTRVVLTCIQTTAGVLNVELAKRSAADTGGTSAVMTAVPDYSSYAVAQSAPLSYTGTGPSVGAVVGDLDNQQIGCDAAATVGPNDVYVFRPLKPVLLNGTGEQVALNLGGAVTGGTITVTFEWEETATP